MKTYIGTKIIKARPMSRGDYNEYRSWAIPSDEDPKDQGYLVEYTNGGAPNDSRHDGYISWSPKDVFEQSYNRIEAIPHVELPVKVTVTAISEKIKEVTYLYHDVLTICILKLENGFTATGESACVNLSEYNKALGEKYAYERAFEKVWALEGYLLRERHYQESLKA